MALTDLFSVLKKTSSNTNTKKIGFNITQEYTLADYAYLLDSTNYLEQYFGWTYRATTLVADSISMYPTKLYKRGGQNQEDVELTQDNSQILKDLYHFNDHQSLLEGRKLITLHKRLTGMAYVYMEISDDRRYKYNFYVLNPERIRVKLDEQGLPASYTFRDVTGQENKIEVEQMLVFRAPNPADWLKGKSIVGASKYQHNTWELMSKFNLNTFGNNGKPQGFLSIEGISSKEKKRIERNLKQKYGGAENANKIGVTNTDLKWIPLSTNPRDLEFNEGIDKMRRDILAMHGVPEALVGYTQDSNYANVEGAQEIYQRYTLKPLLMEEESALNEQLISRYYSNTQTGEGSLVYFKFDDPVEKNQEKVANAISILYNSNIINLNEARIEIGQTKVDGGEKFNREFVQENIQNNPVVQNQADQIKKLSTRIKSLDSAVNNLPTIQEQREQYRKELKDFYYEKNLNTETKFIDVVKGYFNAQQERLLHETKAIKTPTITLDLNKEQEDKIGIEVFAPLFQQIAKDYLGVASEIVGTGDVPLSVEAQNELRNNLKYFVNEINTTTRTDIQKLIANAIENNQGMDVVRNGIKDLFDRYTNGGSGITNTRSMTIARTETNAVKNLATYDRYTNDDFVDKIEWLTARDGDVRLSHQQMDGKAVDKNGAFLVPRMHTGGFDTMKRPHDRAGSAENVINCRCDILPIVKNEMPMVQPMPSNMPMANNPVQSEPTQTEPIKPIQLPYINITNTINGTRVNNVLGSTKASLDAWRGSDNILELYRGVDNEQILSNGLKYSDFIKQYGFESGSANTFGRGVYASSMIEGATPYGDDLYKLYVKIDKLKFADYENDLLADPNCEIFKMFEKKRREDAYAKEEQKLKDAVKANKISNDEARNFAKELLKKYSTNDATLTSEFAKNKGYDGITTFFAGRDIYILFDTTEKFILTNSFLP